jgi:hypothetical protein
MLAAEGAMYPLLLLFGCGKLFSIKVDGDVTTTVEHGSIIENLTGGLGFSEFTNMDISDAEELKNQGVAPGDIQDVKFTAFSLEATAPTGTDLSFLQSMTLSVSGPDLPEEVVATADAFPEGEPLVEFDLTDLDLTPYAVSQNMDLITDVNGHRPDADTTVVAHYALKVGVTGQGVFSQ